MQAIEIDFERRCQQALAALRQCQLVLNDIVDNPNVPVSSDEEVYDTVKYTLEQANLALAAWDDLN